MKRAFYTDPQAAAWMERKFCMDFVNTAGVEISIIDGDIFAADDGSISDHAYIHPDSMHLLEPRAGDLVLIPGWGIEYIGTPTHWYAKMLKASGRIIQRNGKPFHWPEFQ